MWMGVVTGTWRLLFNYSYQLDMNRRVPNCTEQRSPRLRRPTGFRFNSLRFDRSLGMDTSEVLPHFNGTG